MLLLAGELPRKSPILCIQAPLFFVEAKVAVGRNKATKASKATPGIDNCIGRLQRKVLVERGARFRCAIRCLHRKGAPDGKPTPNAETWESRSALATPGTSGNPAGYSHGRRISDAIERLIEEMAPDREFGATARRLECRQRSSSSERPPVARAGLLERFGQRLGLAFAVHARQGRMPFGQQHGVAVELVVVNNLDVRDFRHRRLEHQKIIIVSRTFELAADVDDHR